MTIFEVQVLTTRLEFTRNISRLVLLFRNSKYAMRTCLILFDWSLTLKLVVFYENIGPVMKTLAVLSSICLYFVFSPELRECVWSYI